MATKTVGVRLDADIQARLKAIAERQDRTPHYLIKKAIEKLVQSEEETANELALMRARWEAFEISGIAHPHEEVKERLLKLTQTAKSA